MNAQTAPRNGMRRWAASFTLRPLVVAVSTVSVPLGLAVILLGERASRAFTVLGGDSAAKLIGLALFSGGLLILTGIFTANSFTELMGSASAAVGFGLYGGGCYLGLGVNGIISGTLAASVAAGYVGRIVLLTTLAKKAARANGQS